LGSHTSIQSINHHHLNFLNINNISSHQQTLPKTNYTDKQTNKQTNKQTEKQGNKMSSTTFTTATQQPTLFGRGGYNGPANSDDDEDSRSFTTSLNFGRGGHSRGPDDEEEDGRGGYN
jgi:hypothetical protein